ncbi:hypothetical protein AMATHDRAFT_53456 [Amanita thiersii Skay4041]|uniref:Uncharacterized protein n=1 Tax=Amanita thiersii Skay4041 TaxID=703135 RepID=A0A2A9P084_9AGAR|nr:hypothetical protein AMATHDRAFT_53456 [Amanita thiersii Skay4041]
MGFFSRKSEDNNDSQLTATTSGSSDNTVVRAIRSRFYGKHKGKERETPNISFIPKDASTAQTLSGPSSHAYAPSASSPLARGRSPKQTPAAAGPSTPRTYHEPAASPLRNAKRPFSGSFDMPPPPPPKSPTIASRQKEREKDSSQGRSPTPTSTPRKTTDSATVTLAQKLNELAIANSEGLLNDDEYRLLRQNLFERFATTSAVPAESPIVPVSKPRPRDNGTPPSDGRREYTKWTAVIALLKVEKPRTPSISSKSSITSGVVRIFRRATGRRSGSGHKDMSDTSSIMSVASGTSSMIRMPFGLTKKSSISSVHTSASRIQADTMSISSRRTNHGSDRLHSESVTSLSPPGSRTASSIRRLNTPPSSFPARAVGIDSRSVGGYSGLYDEDHLQSSQEITQEILALEAEARSMMDAFNGLELATLVKVQKATGRSSVVAPDGQSLHRMNIDMDSTSIRSGMSVGTSPSMVRSTHSIRKVKTRPNLAPSTVQGSTFLHRKNSSSSFGSSQAPGYGEIGPASNSNISLVRSGPMSIVLESSEGSIVEGEDEMEKVKRRREEVRQRYEARLEYLRAKLKGAQLHEKLLRK